MQNIVTYPLYHTLYDTRHVVVDIIDRQMVCHRALAQLWAEVARNLSESVILPLNVTRYATYLTDALSSLKSVYNDRLEANGAGFRD